MYTLTVQNKYGAKLELTNSSNYQISNIDGLAPPDAILNWSQNVNSDGSIFNSSYLSNRQIILTLAINAPTEENRINLYNYFKNKYPLRLYYENDSRKVYIDGFCKNMDIRFFGIKQIAQITIICGNPYFLSTKKNISELSNVASFFEFPFEIVNPIPFSEVTSGELLVVNNGDAETGMKLTLQARNGSVVNPVVYLANRNEYLGFNLTLDAGDSIIINTNAKEKSAVAYPHEAAEQNVLRYLKNGSSWLQLDSGYNYFLISADTGSQYFYMIAEFEDKFEGV